MFTNLTSIRAAIYQMRKTGNPGSRNVTRGVSVNTTFHKYFKREMFLERQHWGVYAAWDIKSSAKPKQSNAGQLDNSISWLIHFLTQSLITKSPSRNSNTSELEVWMFGISAKPINQLRTCFNPRAVQPVRHQARTCFNFAQLARILQSSVWNFYWLLQI